MSERKYTIIDGGNMMKTTCLLTGRGKCSNATQNRAQIVARKHGADFLNFQDPGQGWIYFFEAANLGAPFDQGTADAIRADLTAAGMDADDLAGVTA